MKNFEHKKLIERISEADRLPEKPSDYAHWIKADAHLELLRDNAMEDELIIYAGGSCTLIQSVVVSRKDVLPIDHADLLQWSGNLHFGCASYCWQVGGDEVRIERSGPISGSRSLSSARALVFARTIDGLQGRDGSYFELSQEYGHVVGIHWRDTFSAYCRFDGRGEWEQVVSVTSSETPPNVSLVSFKREPLEEYLAASDSILVRMFDFTLLNRAASFRGWPEGEENVVKKREMVYRQKVDAGKAAYTTGVQVVMPRRSKTDIFAAIMGKSRATDHRHVAFVAYDGRNKRISNISTAPDATTNYFQAQQNDLPHELSPAFFNPEVLLRYKGDRDKYTVEERKITCRGAWELRGYDVNKAGQIHAYIRDLRELPFEEQQYWQSFNEAPKTGISERAFKNDFMAEWVDDRDPLSEIKSIMDRWSEEAVAWWTLRDERLVGRVSTPRTNSRDEWATAFKEMSKLLVECFDIRGIRGELDRRRIAWCKDEQSLALIERLVGVNPKGLKMVQRVRSKVDAHVGGEEADLLSDDALKQHGSYAVHFQQVCRDVINELRLIEQAFSEQSPTAH